MSDNNAFINNNDNINNKPTKQTSKKIIPTKKTYTHTYTQILMMSAGERVRESKK